MAVIGDAAAIEIGSHRHRLAYAHVSQLHFLEIGVDPDIGQRHHRHQRRARRDLLAHLHRALGDHAIHRRHQPHVTERYGGVAQIGFRRQHIGIVGDMGAINLRQGMIQSALGGIDRGSGSGLGIPGMGQLLARHRARGGGGLAALQIALRLVQRDLSLRQLGAIGIGAGKFAAHHAHGAGKIGLGGGHVHIGGGRIEFDQKLALLDSLGIVNMQRQHCGIFARRHRHHIARDIGIIGALVKTRVQEPVKPITHRRDQQHNTQDQESQAAIVMGDRGIAHDIIPVWPRSLNRG